MPPEFATDPDPGWLVDIDFAQLVVRGKNSGGILGGDYRTIVVDSQLDAITPVKVNAPAMTWINRWGFSRFIEGIG